MNSKERILSAFKLETPDRVPVSVNITNPGLIRINDSILVDLIENTDPIIWVLLDNNFPGYEAIFGKKIYEYSKIDKDSNKIKITVFTPKGKLTQITERRGESDWIIEYFFKNLDDIDKFFSLTYEPFDKKSINLNNYLYWEKIIGNEGLVSIAIGDAAVMLYCLLGPEKYYIALMDDYNIVKRFTAVCAKRIESYVRSLFKLIDEKFLTFLISGPEMLSSPMAATKYYKELVVPFDKNLIELIHKYGGIANLHEHGKIKDVLDFIIEMNPDAASPFEEQPAGDITLKEAKEKLHNKVCIIGNLDDLQLLSKKNKGEIVLKSFKLLRDVAKNGGFILGGTDSSIIKEETAKSFILMGKICSIYGNYPLDIEILNEKINILEL